MKGSLSERWSERIRVYPLLMGVAYVVVFAGFVLFRQGLDPFATDPRDFMAFWVVSGLAAEGRLAEAYDAAVLSSIYESFNKPSLSLPWFYPPHFSLVTSWFPAVPYWACYLGHVALGVAVFAMALRFLELDVTAWRVALLAPVVFLNLLFGQTGAMVTALMVTGLLAGGGRWWLGALAIGALTVKPQFGLLMPVLLLAKGDWKTIAVASVTALALGALSVSMFGVEAWRAFAGVAIGAAGGAAASGAMTIPLTAAPSAGLILIGVPSGIALSVQAAVIVALAAFVVWLVRRGAPDLQLAAVVMAGSVLAAPHSIVYDWVLLVPPVAITLQAGLDRGFLRFEPAVLVVAWVTPFLILIAQDLRLPLAPPVAIALFAVVARRAVRSCAPR